MDVARAVAVVGAVYLVDYIHLAMLSHPLINTVMTVPCTAGSVMVFVCPGAKHHPQADFIVRTTGTQTVHC